MTQFDKDYKLGKQSEKDSLKDLEEIFQCKLNHDPFEFAHFDFFNDDIMVELKTRPDIKLQNNGTIELKGNYIESLYFDSVKMGFAVKHNKILRLEGNKMKRFFIVWKCSGQYLYWEMLFNEKSHIKNRDDYFLEDQNRDFGFGFKQEREVVNVYVDKITAH